jgi:hypothetical protein
MWLNTKFRAFWYILSCNQTDVDIGLTTRQCISQGSARHTRHRENLKSHMLGVKVQSYINICCKAKNLVGIYVIYVVNILTYT